MLTPDEFPQIAAQIGGAAAPSRPLEAAPAPAEPIEFDVAGALPVPPAADGVATVDEAGDVRSLADVEAAMIRLALERYSGRMTLVARKLGIGRSTLYRKLKDLGISDTVSGIAAE
jgi:DNA-binding NtrC family response regulator